MKEILRKEAIKICNTILEKAEQEKEQSFIESFIKSQKDLAPEYSECVDKHFWELV